MARLYIRHDPVAYDVEDSVQSNRFYVSREILHEHGIRYDTDPNNTDVTYVCFVHEGKCWAARYFTVMGNKQIRVDCVPFNDNPSGQLMVMKDLILG